MEIAFGSHASVTPAFSLSTRTNSSNSRSFGFSASLLKVPFFGCTSSNFYAKRSINYFSRNPIQKSIKCSVSQATEITAGNNICSFLILLNWVFS